MKGEFTLPGLFRDQPLVIHSHTDEKGDTVRRIVSSEDTGEVFAIISVDTKGEKLPAEEFVFAAYNGRKLLLQKLLDVGAIEMTRKLFLFDEFRRVLPIVRIK